MHMDVTCQFLEESVKVLIATLKKHPIVSCKNLIKCDGNLSLLLCILIVYVLT